MTNKHLVTTNTEIIGERGLFWNPQLHLSPSSYYHGYVNLTVLRQN
jgi:hypothetical protein